MSYWRPTTTLFLYFRHSRFSVRRTILETRSSLYGGQPTRPLEVIRENTTQISPVEDLISSLEREGQTEDSETSESTQASSIEHLVSSLERDDTTHDQNTKNEVIEDESAGRHERRSQIEQFPQLKKRMHKEIRDQMGRRTIRSYMVKAKTYGDARWERVIHLCLYSHRSLHLCFMIHDAHV